ncbi:MAG TPA: hypothetical protein VL463_23830 [Kofleriaceae bacterium]|nr:hypothetical protein [Kofleriaceae bacterium]
MRLAIAIVIVTAASTAHAKDRVLFSASGKALGAGAGVKAGASCKVEVTTADAGECPSSCAATITCGKVAFDLGTTYCGQPESWDQDCAAAYTKKIFEAKGEKGQIDVGDGLAIAGTGDDSAGYVALTFAGGRAKGDPEGKPKWRMKETRKVTVEGPLPLASKSCSVELGAYQDDPLDHPCEFRCLAKISCGVVKVSRVGTCSIPYRYTSDGGQCYGEPQAFTFEERYGSGATITIGGEKSDRAVGTFPLLYSMATLTLAP